MPLRLDVYENYERGDWNRLIASLPGAHLLQTHEWGQVKSRFGWRPMYAVWLADGRPAAAALLLERAARLPFPGPGLRVLYAPRGPLLDWADAPVRDRVLADLAGLARRRKAIFVKIDPNAPVGVGRPGEEDACDFPAGLELVETLRRTGWRSSSEQIQFRNTAVLDLSRSEDELLAAMKQKTRYNIRLAARKGVVVRDGSEEDFHGLYQLYAQTAARDNFVIRDEAYYLDLWNTLHVAGKALPLIAEVDGRMIAAVMVFWFSGAAWYMQGMSGPEHRELMPNYLLQWEAITRLKALGVVTYDLWGAPDEFVESDPLWGVYRFKEGLGAQVVFGPGAWDYPARPLLYPLYMQALPRLLDVLRRRGKQRTQRIVAG
jgi:lipid II:glycine glycyltransferase (peptidoglycan interpeptide bridge formation enzyme)